jgi:glutamyl-tRNA synthetase
LDHRLQKGATSVSADRDLGYVPEALVNFLALLGWSYDGQREMFTLPDLVELFRLERVGGNPAVFDLTKLEWMNGQYLKQMSDEARESLVTAFLAARGFELGTRDLEWRLAFVRALGDRLKTLVDAERYGAFALVEAPRMDDEAQRSFLDRPDSAAHLAALADRLASGSFDLEGNEAATRALAKELGIKAGDLMGLARIALTGRRIAPGIFEVMELLGPEPTLQRLRQAADLWSRESPHAQVT